MQIRFDTDPESLLETADPTNLYNDNLHLDPPTPTLVGLPINNDGYEALRTAYGQSLVSALFGYSLGYRWCRHAPFYQAILTYQLSELGLAEWPVTQEINARLASDGVHTDMLFPYWASQDFADVSDENSYYLFSFVDFLGQRNMLPTALVESMERTRSFSPGCLMWGKRSPVKRLLRIWWRKCRGIGGFLP